MGKILVICDADPYDGSDKVWHALRVAKFSVEEGHTAKMFLISDGVLLAHETVDDTSGELEIGELLNTVKELGVEIAACGTCLGMRRLDEDGVRDGIIWGTMKILVDWIDQADKVINF
ncbi:MAG: DsrE family protein [bacterium]|nr:DsrE family protein [bacterium]